MLLIQYAPREDGGASKRMTRPTISHQPQRENEKNIVDRESEGMPPATKMGQTELSVAWRCWAAIYSTDFWDGISAFHLFYGAVNQKRNHVAIYSDANTIAPLGANLL